MRPLLLGLVLLVATTASAQNTLTHARYLDSSQPADLYDCGAVVPAPAYQWGVRTGDQVWFCSSEVTPAAASLLTYRVQVDGVQTESQTSATCTGMPVACSVPLHTASLTPLAATGLHRLSLTSVNPTTGETSASSAELQVVSGCLTVNVDVSPPLALVTVSPIGTTLGRRTQVSTQNLMTAVQLLRARGWRVEWQRVQFGVDVTAGSGYWYLGAWCQGVPQ